MKRYAFNIQKNEHNLRLVYYRLQNQAFDTGDWRKFSEYSEWFSKFMSNPSDGRFIYVSWQDHQKATEYSASAIEYRAQCNERVIQEK